MKLDEKELQQIQTAQKDFSEAKMTLADLELNKQVVVNEINKMRVDFTEFESKLVEKYGKDSSINMQTGEVTKADSQPLQKVT